MQEVKLLHILLYVVYSRFPSKPDALVPDEQIEERMRQLEEYLRNLLKIPLYRDHHETVRVFFSPKILTGK